MTDVVSEVIPIFMVRLVEDSGWIMNGGAAHRGRLGVTSPTPFGDELAGAQQVGALIERSSIFDRSDTDLERMTSRPGMPAMDCSNGTVTSSSTSVAERPRHGTCTSTRGGANSGNDVDGRVRQQHEPKAITADAAGDHEVTELQARPDDPAQHGGDPPSFSAAVRVASLDAEFGAPELGRSGRHDRGADLRSRRQDGPVAADALDRDRLADVASGPPGWCRR